MTTEDSMDYKAKYEEALKRADAAINIAADKDLVKGVAITIFPELRESEDEKIRKNLVDYFKQFDQKYMWDEDISFKDIVAFLEKQKEQKPEWSGEDEKVIADSHKQLICFADSWERGGYPDNADAVRKIASKLKSLRPQPKWKPSEEQMEALNYAIAEWDGGKRLEGLYALRNDLKKLMEE